MKFNKKVISGALSLTISGLLVKVLGLIYKIPLSYILTEEGMSYFNSAYTVYTFFYIVCTAGIPKAISILTSEAESDGDREKVKIIYRTSFTFFFLFGALTTFIFIFLCPILSKSIGNSNAFLTMLSVAPSIFFVCSSGVMRGYYSGTLNFVPIAISELISGVIRLILGTSLAFIGNGIGLDFPALSALTMLGTTIGSFFGFAYLLLTKKSIKSTYNSKQNNTFFNLEIAKKILLIAIPLTLTAAIGSIGNIIDMAIIIRRLLSSDYSELQAGILYGNYTTLVIPMLNLAGTLIAPVSAVLLPIISKTTVKNNDKYLSGGISTTIKLILFVTTPLSVLFFCASREVLMILFEKGSAILGAPMLTLISPGIALVALLSVINTALEGIGKVKIPLISLTVGSISKIVLTYFFVGSQVFGILGASIATVLSYSISIMISCFYLHKDKNIQLQLHKCALPSLLSALAAGTIIYFLKTLFDIQTRLASLILVCTFGLIYIFFYTLFSIRQLKNCHFLSKYTKKRNIDYK